MKLLLTGFTPFPGVEVNPSALVVERIITPPEVELIREILPVIFTTAGEQLKGLIRQHQPDALIMLGVAAGRESISLERFALNINDAAKPDNEGALATGNPIVPDGPAAYRSTLPLETIHSRMEAAHIPVKYSNHAGAYLCNHVFYVARHLIDSEGLLIPAGFIHIPQMREAVDDPTEEPNLPLEMMTHGIEQAIIALHMAFKRDASLRL